jgi:hypothetical protein
MSHFSALCLDQPPFSINAKLVLEVDPPFYPSFAVYGRSFKLRTFLVSKS